MSVPPMASKGSGQGRLVCRERTRWQCRGTIFSKRSNSQLTAASRFRFALRLRRLATLRIFPKRSWSRIERPQSTARTRHMHAQSRRRNRCLFHGRGALTKRRYTLATFSRHLARKKNRIQSARTLRAHRFLDSQLDRGLPRPLNRYAPRILERSGNDGNIPESGVYMVRI